MTKRADPTQNAPPALRRGTRLGKYVLVGRLGEGGFSQVWKARDTIEGLYVALKIPQLFGMGSEAEEELLAEIRISAKLEHPNILRTRNADWLGHTYVIASDLAEETLEDRLTRRLATTKAVSFAHQILKGLAFAHRDRILHRDLKPANLMVFAGDQLRIADFGLARKIHQTVLSATGSGTLEYSAPEQMHGYPCLASDVFSTGLIMYQMFAHTLPRWPYEWPPPNFKILKKKIPAELVGVIRKAIRPDSRQRFFDANDMLTAFERCQPAIDRHLFRRPRPKRQRPRLGQWRSLRFQECRRAFGRQLFLSFECPQCSGPISEHWTACAWCGSRRTRFREQADFACFCPRCGGGMHEEWRFCPWCWGPSFADDFGQLRADRRYTTACRWCGLPMIAGMHYCPWCHRRQKQPNRIAGMVDVCPSCKSSVTKALWDHCPWCGHLLHRS